MYYYLAEIKDKVFSIKRPMSDDEHTKLVNVIKIVWRFYDKSQKNNNFDISYNDLISAINCEEKRDYNQISVKPQKALSEYLFEFRKFLDNWETELCRTYGKDSKEYFIFKDAQAEEFDTHMEYRIMYRLRNYDQHCGNIISRITTSLGENNQVIRSVFMDRDKLVSEFKEWKKEELDYLNSLENDINIMPYITQLKNSVFNIYAKTMMIYCDKELLDACVKIINVANEFDNEEFVNIIMSTQEINKELFEQETQKFSIRDMMVPYCKSVLIAHMFANNNYVKVFFYGEDYKEKLKGFALEVNEEHKNICNAEFVSFGGQDLIRVLRSIKFDKFAFYAVFVDRRMPISDVRIIEDDYEAFLKALCKE